MSEEGTPAAPAPRRRLRRGLVTVLIVLTSLSVVVTTVAWWAHSVVFDTDHYVATVGPLIRDRQVVDALSVKLTDAVMDGLQVQERMTVQIAQAIERVLEPKGVGVVVDAAHLCMMMRGVQKQNSSTMTSCLLGSFRSDFRTRNEFLGLVRSIGR